METLQVELDGISDKVVRKAIFLAHDFWLRKYGAATYNQVGLHDLAALSDDAIIALVKTELGVDVTVLRLSYLRGRMHLAIKPTDVRTDPQPS